MSRVEKRYIYLGTYEWNFLYNQHEDTISEIHSKTIVLNTTFDSPQTFDYAFFNLQFVHKIVYKKSFLSGASGASGALIIKCAFLASLDTKLQW